MSWTHSYNIIKVQWYLQDTPRVQLGPEGLPVKVRKFSCFYLPNGGSRSQRPMNHKIRHNFQDQTFTAKLITPPKSTYKLRLNGLCHIPGTFYWARSAKFRHVWSVFKYKFHHIWVRSNTKLKSLAYFCYCGQKSWLDSIGLTKIKVRVI